MTGAAAAGAGLDVAGLTVSRGARTLFSGLAFTLARGEALLLRGANGSGKTSLLRALAGLCLADAGEVRWQGLSWQGLAPARREATLYLGHANAIKDELSAAENLAGALALDGVAATAAARTAALDMAGLAGRHDIPAARLSQGQKRRIGMARLSLSPKPLWLLDEPTNALDADGTALFERLVGAHLAAGGVACIATHLPMALAGQGRELDLGGAVG